jgi:cobalamin-dependent methionine synthase I
MLSGCEQILLMGATAGQTIMEEISLATQGENLTRAVILDAVASEMTDSGLDWIMDYMNQELMRKARRLTKARFSAGYGDFSLENQKAIHALLRLDKIGVFITDRFILMPEKSVTAVAGIVALKQNM